jgi:hypothetical protein
MKTEIMLLQCKIHQKIYQYYMYDSISNQPGLITGLASLKKKKYLSLDMFPHTKKRELDLRNIALSTICGSLWKIDDITHSYEIDSHVVF